MLNLQPELAARLERIAKQKNITVNELLSDFADDLEDTQKYHEQQLRREAQYHRGLVESQIDLVCRYTPDTILTYVNDAYCRYFGRTRDELIGTSFLDLSSDSDTVISEVYARIQAVLKDPSPDSKIFYTRDDMGNKKWIQWVDYGITDSQGTVTEIQAIGRDITDLMTTKDKLTQRQTMLSTIVKNIPVMLAQFDSSGKFEYVNDHWVNVLGWTVPEMRQQPDMMALFYPDPNIRQEALDYMLAAESGWREFDTHAKDGSIIRTSWANVQLEDGRSIGIGVDLSERTAIEKRLRSSEEKYRNLVETAHDLIWSVSRDGQITYINQASEHIYGYTPDEMIGRYFQDFVPPDQMEANYHAWQTAIEHNDKLFNFENWVLDKNGERILLNTNVVLIRDNENNVIGSMGTAQNITHRRELEKQRIYAAKLEVELEKEREIQQTKDRFVSLVSHEFRTPLSVMQSSTSLINRYFDQLPKERILEKLTTVNQQIQRMVELMEDALRYSKSEAGKTEFQSAPIAIIPFLRNVIETLEIVDEQHHHLILQGTDGIIMADAKLLYHIFANLISNALKYSPDNTTITISIDQLPKRWRFTLVDEGMGIPDQDLPHLFEPFHRASNASDKAGTGLGLSIVKEYVELHRGSIAIDSKVGVGTTITLVLPKE